jgi:hypothetical protein
MKMQNTETPVPAKARAWQFSLRWLLGLTVAAVVPSVSLKYYFGVGGAVFALLVLGVLFPALGVWRRELGPVVWGLGLLLAVCAPSLVAVVLLGIMIHHIAHSTLGCP